MQGDGEKTPWWMWPLLPLWLFVQVVSFVFVIAFAIWRVLLYLTIPVVIIGVVVLLITGGGDDSSTNAATSLGPAQRYNEEAVAVLNKYQAYRLTLPKATPANLDKVVADQIRAERTAIADFAVLTVPADLESTHNQLLSEMRHEITLSEETLDAFDRGEQKRLNGLISEISDGLVEYNRLGTEIYEVAEEERGR